MDGNDARGRGTDRRPPGREPDPSAPLLPAPRRPPSRAAGRVVVVEPEPELDLCSAPLLRAQLARALADRPDHVVVDLSDVRFLSVTALAVLDAARDEAARTATTLHLAGGGAAVVRALDVAALRPPLRHHATLEQAREDLAGDPCGVP